MDIVHYLQKERRGRCTPRGRGLCNSEFGSPGQKFGGCFVYLLGLQYSSSTVPVGASKFAPVILAMAHCNQISLARTYEFPSLIPVSNPIPATRFLT